MNYKQEFISKAHTIFAENISKKRELEHFQKVVIEFFESIWSELEEVLEVSNERLKYFENEDQTEFEIEFDSSKLVVVFFGKDIVINVQSSSAGYEEALNYENEYTSTKYNAKLDDDLLSQYLKDSFDYII
jgi:hypothetical protein